MTLLGVLTSQGLAAAGGGSSCSWQVGAGQQEAASVFAAACQCAQLQQCSEASEGWIITPVMCVLFLACQLPLLDSLPCMLATPQLCMSTQTAMGLIMGRTVAHP